MSLCNHEASVVRLPVCLSVRLSVCKLCTNHYFYHRRARIQDVLKVKVKVKGHVIRTLLITRKSLLLPQT